MDEDLRAIHVASVVRAGIHKSPSQRYGVSCIRAGDCRRSHRRAKEREGERQDGEKKVANQLLADGATTPGRGCNVLGLLIPR